MVIDLPAGPNASGVGDFWQHSVTDMGQTGPDEGKGGKYLIVGPGQAEPPNTEGYIVVHSTTINIWPGFRALDPDPAKAQEWIEKVRIYPYSPREIFYVLHVFLIHTMAILVGSLGHQPVSWLWQGGFIMQPPPAGYSHGLPFVYLMWFIALLILYLPCKWYMAFKSRHRDRVWLSYL